MSTIEKFEDLDLWKNARELCKIIFNFANKEHFSKDFKLKEQIRGASGSVMDNIAEGFEREGNKEFIQFLFLQKDHVVKLNLSFIELSTIIILQRMNLNQLIKWQMKFQLVSQIL